MTVEVWLEDAAGTRLGSGPIMSAQGSTQTDRLNAAGEFAFSVPTLDPQAALIRPFRWARSWHYDPFGGWQQVGYGRIERVTNSIDTDGNAILSVAGVNELGALADRICNNLSLMTYAQRHPTEVVDDATPLPLTIDYQPGDLVTNASFALGAAGAPLHLRSPRAFDKVSFSIGTGNANTAVLTATYFDTTAADWLDVDINEDTTISTPPYAFSLNHSGAVTFTPPATWGPEPGSGLYELRLYSSGTMFPAVECFDIAVWAWEPRADPLAAVMAYAPAGWGLDVADGYGEVQPRATGAELLTDGGFEEFTGTEDDTTTDAWDHWTVGGAGATAKVLAVTTADTGSYAVSLTNGGARAHLRQVVSGLTAGQEYTLSFRTRGDATGEAGYQIVAGDYGATYEAITGIVDTGIVGTTWATITDTFILPAAYTAATVLFWSPPTASSAAYVDTVSLKPGGGGAVYLQLRDETVLTALTRMAEATDQNFLLSPAGQKVLWLGYDKRASELRAVAASAHDPADAGAANMLLLLSLTETHDASQLASRVYPFGAGMGAERLTLNEVTIPAPAGYVLSKAYNYLERTAAVTALGVIETVQSWSDIKPADTSVTQRQYAANALLWQAWQYLEQHSATNTERVYGDVPRFYAAAVVKCARMILPGFTLRLQYDAWRDGVEAIHIDGDVWVTAVTREIGGDGVYVAGLELATVPRAVADDNVLIARNLIRLGKLSSHNTAEGY
jgi:hypothetical protein